MSGKSAAFAGLGLWVGLMFLIGGKRSADSERLRPLGRGATPIEVVRREIERWKDLDENDAEGRRWIEYYWRNGPKYFPGHDQPWSGAFLTWAVNAAYPGALRRTGGHVDYVQGGISPSARENYHTFLGTLPVVPGDIVVKPRLGEHRQFQEVREGMFPSHGDLILSVKEGKAIAAGGNKRDKVTADVVSLNPDGTFPGAFAVLRRGTDYPSVVADVPGYRRARGDEVTPEMESVAVKELKNHVPGEIIYSADGSWAIAFETHDGPRGLHKGASAFIREGNA